MPRTKFAKDKKKRKSRRDPKKKYTKHKGKFIPYKPKRDRNDPVRIWWWERIPMSLQGVQHFPKQVRPYVNRVITKFGVMVNVLPEELSTAKDIENLALITIGYPGNFLLMMPCHSRNAWRVSYKKVARIIITESSEGLNAKMVENFRLFRYFFWKG